ncbi:PAS domain-containing protein [Hymenobacter cheonanensis]|uniref:PAS domain-containing protein n=1 Tax=Hymenobacter sp. CA2-7 TaxID=3063993 RepID=UPI002713022D|nr:PAS domain-containing protein [Hymenobacter sp. CA2-7]MDO7887072.1 PAS domain-containing protein [Hymenobacter sp. CA2-7]
MPAPALPVDYQNVFRSLPENFLLIAPNPEATILDNTDSHVAVSLKSREAAVGKPFFEAYPATSESGAAQIRESHEHVRRYLEPHTMPLIRYDLARPEEQGGGLEEFYWQATHYPIIDAQGQLQYILQRTQNVTEQLRAARAAAEAQQRLTDEQERTRFILQNLPVLIWTATPDGQRDYFNLRWLEFTGREMSEELGEKWLANLHPDDRGRVRDEWAQSVAAGTPYQVEYRLRRHDGQYRWILSRAHPRRDAEGHINLWVGGATDIHDQKMMVQEILEANEQQAALAEQSYAHYQLAQQQRQSLLALFQQAPAQIGIVRGADFRYEFANASYQAAMGGRELVGRTVAEAVPEIAQLGLLDTLNEVYRTGQPYEAHEMPINLRQADGSTRPAYFTYIIQRFEEKGEPAGLTSYAYEVTELVQARAALARLQPLGGGAAPGPTPPAAA